MFVNAEVATGRKNPLDDSYTPHPTIFRNNDTALAVICWTPFEVSQNSQKTSW